MDVWELRTSIELADEGEFSMTRAWELLNLEEAIVRRIVARYKLGLNMELEGVQEL